MMSKIHQEIGAFSAQAYINNSFKTVTKEDVMGKWSVFFFYPADFTFVCPTELEDLANKYEEFKNYLNYSILPFLKQLIPSTTILEIKFDEFVSKGQFGEMSRMYASVNYRDMSKVHSAFLHYLIFCLRNPVLYNL